MGILIELGKSSEKVFYLLASLCSSALCVTLMAFLSPQASADVANCRKALFADAVQANHSQGSIYFDFDARLISNADQTLSAASVNQHPDSNLSTCGSFNCKASATSSPSQQLAQFRLSESTFDYTVPFDSTSYIGVAGQREYRVVNAESEATIEIDESGHHEFEHYVIDTINLGHKATLNLRSGNYWVRQLNMESESSINVLGDGVVRLHIYSAFTPGWLARLNVSIASVAQSPNKLVVIPYSGAQFNTNLVSAYIYSPAALVIGPQSDFYGALSGASVTLQNGSKVNYLEPNTATNLGQLCSAEIGPDADGDVVPDVNDQCDGTPAGETVDSNGCSATQRDTDLDGVADSVDQCVGTQLGALVGEWGCSMGQASNCREQLFADGIQTHSASGAVQFGYNASIVNNPDAALNTALTQFQSGSTIQSCGSAHCAPSGTPSAPHQLEPFQFTTDSNGYQVQYNSSGYLGVSGRRDYGDVHVASYAVLSGDVQAHDESQPYHLKSLMLDYNSRWNVLPGTYWVEKLTLGYGALMNVVGDGVVRIYARETVSFGGANKINYISNGVQKPDQFLLVSYDGISTGGGNAAGYFVAAGNVSLGYQFNLHGAINGANLVTNSESTVLYQMPNERTNLGQICADDISDLDVDGVLDRYDACAETESGVEVDSSGCAQYQLDSDGDGVNNQVELDDGTDPLNPDSDGDGVDDGVEKADGTNPLNLDSDRDTLSDSVEKELGTNPLNSDSDQDGIDDNVEVGGPTDPLNNDSDGDEVPDGVDAFPTDVNESSDTDSDGVGDNADSCASTPAGAEIDQNGCAATQLDSDGDGVSNASDICPSTPVGERSLVNAQGCGPSERDTDGDGVNDNADAFPDDPTETLDADADGVGDNGDACALTPAGKSVNADGCAAIQLDADSDGVSNDLDLCPSTPASELAEVNLEGCGPSQRDTDGDGVNDNVDAFPSDASETSDLDGDGIGDNADADRDGDGVLNEQDLFPNNPNESSDLDLDGIGDKSDQDRDGDGFVNDADACPSLLLPPESVGPDGCEIVMNVDTDGDGFLDADDAFPSDPLEWSDLDGDGVGDNSDADIDGDGVTNYEDRFPRDSNESSDIDNDGVGDNSDSDRDNDGVDNALDLFPSDPLETTDLDGDGIGDNSDPDRDGDGVLNDSDAYPDDPVRSKLPIVTIDSPNTLVTVGYSPIMVAGTVEADAQAFTVNGVPVASNGGTWSVAVALEEGHNTIVARMVDVNGVASTASIHVSLDLTPPYMTIDSHEHEQIVYTPSIAVTGLINDIVRGTIEDEQVQVTVNNLPATIKNRSYFVDAVPLLEGENEISVVGIDQAGNAAVNTIRVKYVVAEGRVLKASAGQGQIGTIFKDLPEPLVVKVLDDAGEPVVNKNVVFRVTQGSGGVKLLPEDPVNRAVLAKTDNNGLAQTFFQLGQRSGIGNHKVIAKVVGYKTQAIFHASAQGAVGNKLSINTGNNQRGGTFQPLPAPFVVAVTDNGANVVAGARVKFEVRRGGGVFENGQSEMIAVTDSDGRASAHVTLGGVEGLDQQVAVATLLDAPLLDESNPLSPVVKITAGFTATGFTPKDPGLTSISGLIMNNQDVPLEGVVVRVDGTTRQAVTDIEGRFTITEAPVGPVYLVADGSTALAEGEYPVLAYNIVTVSGVDNPLAAPIYMVKINTENAVLAGPEGVALTLPDVPGFKLEVPGGSVTFPDGSREGLLSVTVVNSSKVPMAPPNGMQPQFIVTIQPAGAMFDPPARLTLPNVDAHSPGAQVEMYSFDHDLEEFVAIGLGTVSENGTVITSNPGVGVIKAGWHCGSQPGGSGTGYDCGECKQCTGDGCEPIPGKSLPEAEQSPTDCKDLKCEGEPEAADETAALQEIDSCAKCVGADPTFDPMLRDKQNDDPHDCKATLCDGTTEPDDQERPPPPGYGSPKDEQCKVCKNGTEAITEEHKPYLSQSDHDCYEKFCDGEHEPRLEEMLPIMQQKYDCQTLWCEGEKTDIPKFAENDHRSDEDPNDCMRYICFPNALSGPEERKFKDDSQAPEDKVISACETEVYECGGSTYAPEVKIKEILKHDGEPLQGDYGPCKYCKTGKLTNKDGELVDEFSFDVSAPAIISARMKAALKRFGSDGDLSLKVSYKSERKRCCLNNGTEGLTSVGSKGFSVEVVGQVPVIGGSWSHGMTVATVTGAVGVTASLTNGVFVKANGNLGLQGSHEENECAGTSCKNYSAELGLGLRVFYEGSVKYCLNGSGGACFGAGINVAGEASASFGGSYHCVKGSSLQGCFKGIQVSMSAGGAVTIDGVSYAVGLKESYGPFLNYCPP